MTTLLLSVFPWEITSLRTDVSYFHCFTRRRDIGNRRRPFAGSEISFKVLNFSANQPVVFLFVCFFPWVLPNAKKSAWSWAWDQMITSNPSADNFKRKRNLDGWILDPAIWSCDTGQWLPCFDNCQLTTTSMCNIILQAPTPARKWHSPWLPRVVDGRAGGRKVTWLPKFLKWIAGFQCHTIQNRPK